MKINAEIHKIEDNFITLRADTQFLQGLETETKYSIEFKKYKSKRSLESNRLFWGILQQIKNETDNDLYDLYIETLIRCDVEYEFMLVLPEAIESLKKVFRAVKVLEYRDYNNKQMAVVKAWIGSSKFDSKCMSKLIDTAIQMAAENNVNIDFIDDLKG